MPFTTLLEEALEAWHYTRVGVITEIENLSEADLRFKPNPDSRTAAEIAVHIAESGMMMSGELSRPDGNFRRKSFPAVHEGIRARREAGARQANGPSCRC